jgi:hypothetical protein
MLRECLACGSDNQTRSKRGLQAKYAVLTCARVPADTVAIAQSVEASRRSCVALAIRAAAIGRLDRSIAIDPSFSEVWPEYR